MAGTPLKKQIREKIEKAGGEAMLMAWFSAGGNRAGLARELDVHPRSLLIAIKAKERYLEAIQQGEEAHADRMADEVVEIADGLDRVAEITPADVARAKTQIEARKWRAGVLGKRYSKQAAEKVEDAPAQVTINVQSLHLDALRKVKDITPSPPAIGHG